MLMMLLQILVGSDMFWFDFLKVYQDYFKQKNTNSNLTTYHANDVIDQKKIILNVIN